MKRKKIAVVSLSDGIWDPRPFRLSKILAEAGYQVTQYGFPTHEAIPALPNWKYIEINSTPFRISKFRLLLNRGIIFLGTQQAAASEWLLRILPAEINSVLKASDADIFVAMDYTLLPVISEITRNNESIFCYEAREYYQGQNHGSLIWRIFMPRIVRAIEGRYIHESSIVTTVSQGISTLLFQNYSMELPPKVIYGFPEQKITPEKKDKGPISLVFHGNLSFDREVDRFVKFFDFRKSNTELTVRGNGSKDYIEELRAIIARRDLGEWVKLEKAVPKSDLIRVTSQYYFGLIPWRNDFPQKKFSMPNKFFEYLAAGLPIICTEGSEIATIVLENGIGIVFSYSEIESLASGLESFNHFEYAIMQRNIQKFLKEYGFGKQKESLLSMYSRLDVR